MICDDENNQTVNRDAFDLFYYILRKRMLNGVFCVADSTALKPQPRQELRKLSRYYGYYGCLLILETPLEICRQRNAQRERRVEESVLLYHQGLLPQVFEDAPNEGWERICVVREEERDIDIVLET
jgi:protein phosphatase